MPLAQEQTVTPLRRGSIEITFYIPGPDPEPEDVQSGRISIQIERSNGELVIRNFDLLQVLTNDDEGNEVHLPALNTLKVYIIERINSEMFII